MGANARRRHGAVDMTPKVGIPYSLRTGLSMTSSRERKKLKAFKALTSTPAGELDPKPLRIGRNRYTIDEATKMEPVKAETLIWAPRVKYEQSQRFYF